MKAFIDYCRVCRGSAPVPALNPMPALNPVPALNPMPALNQWGRFLI
jgi:hypothetical protein